MVKETYNKMADEGSVKMSIKLFFANIINYLDTLLQVISLYNIVQKRKPKTKEEFEQN